MNMTWVPLGFDPRVGQLDCVTVLLLEFWGTFIRTSILRSNSLAKMQPHLRSGDDNKDANPRRRQQGPGEGTGFSKVSPSKLLMSFLWRLVCCWVESTQMGVEGCEQSTAVCCCSRAPPVASLSTLHLSYRHGSVSRLCGTCLSIPVVGVMTSIACSHNKAEECEELQIFFLCLSVRPFWEEIARVKITQLAESLKRMKRWCKDELTVSPWAGYP